MQVEQRPHVNPGPTADELEREGIRRRLEEFERSSELPTPEIEVDRMSVTGGLLRFGENFRSTSVARTPRRLTAPDFEAV